MAGNSVTPHGNRVAVYWDQRRVVKGEDWDWAIVAGLLHSLCVFHILSSGAMAPLTSVLTFVGDMTNPASGPHGERNIGTEPMGRRGLQGKESDDEDCLLKVSGLNLILKFKVLAAKLPWKHYLFEHVVMMY